MATENRKIQLEAALDTTGAKAGFQDIKDAGRDMAQSVAQAGQQASKGIEAVGSGADASAKKTERATNSIIAAVQRTIAVAEAGERSNSKYFDVLARQRGANLDALKPWLEQLDAVNNKTRTATASVVDFSSVTTSLGAQPYVQQLRDATTQTKALTEATRDLNATRRSTLSAPARAGFDMAGVTTSLGASSFTKPLGNPSTSLGASGWGTTNSRSGIFQWLGLGSEAQVAGEVASKSLEKVTVSAAQTRAALATLPAQFSDIVVSLQGGQRPLSVLLQQGSQIKDSFGGIGPAARALGGYVLGLVTPFTVAAAAAGALTLAYFQGAKETENYNKALILTGNYLGLTISQMQTYAREISLVVGTQGKAAEALTSLATGGKVASDAFTSVGTAVVLMNRVLGTSIDDAVSTFTKLADEPAKASVKLNESLHYLTLATYERIRSLEEQGDKEAAAALAQRTLAEATTTRLKSVEASAGSLERAWRALTDIAKQAWDAMLGVGRQQSVGDALGVARAKLAESQAQAGRGPQYAALYAPAIERQSQVVADLSRRALREGENAYAEGERTRANSAKIAASDRLKTLSDEVKSNADKRKKAIEELNKDFATLGKPLIGAEYDKLVANINDKFKDPKGAAGKAYTDDAGTRVLEQLRQQEASLKEQLGSSEKLTASQKEQAKYLQLFIDLKDKRQLTAEQKSLLANQDAIKAQLAQNVETEKQVKLKEEAAKLDEKRKKDAEDFARQITGINISIASSNESRADQQERALGAFGLGDRARQEVDAQRTIRREYEAYKRQLTKDAAEKNQLGSDAYKAEVEKIQVSLDQALQSQQAYFEALKAKQADWRNGATTALANFIDDVDDAAKRAQEVTSSGLNGLTDSITGLATGDKGSSIKDAGARIGKLIVRGIVEQQFTKPLAEWLQSSLKDPQSLIGNVLGGLTSNKGTGESWLSMFGFGKAADSDPLGAFLKSKGLLGDVGTTSAATATASLAAAATSAAAALSSLAASAGGSSFTGAGGAGGLLGSLFGSGSSGASGSDPLGAFIAFNGWDSGGWTGPGARHQVAGVVHRDEFVLNKDATNAIGPRGREALDRLNRRGVAGGSYATALLGDALRLPSREPVAAGDTYISIPVEGQVDRRTRNQIAGDIDLSIRRQSRLQ